MQKTQYSCRTVNVCYAKVSSVHCNFSFIIIIKPMKLYISKLRGDKVKVTSHHITTSTIYSNCTFMKRFILAIICPKLKVQTMLIDSHI